VNEVSPELRWNPQLGDWVIVSAQRETRPWQLTTTCPFCPGAPETLGDWDVLVLPNRFPALEPKAEKPALKPKSPYKVSKANGVCEVVVETREHEGDLCDLSLEHMAKVIEVFKSRYQKLGSLSYVKYVLIFRNKGAVIGVSLHHPHSQIYALPFTPPKIRRELNNAKRYMRRSNRCLFCDILDFEKSDRIRVIYENEAFTVFTAFSAMWPYETHIYPRRHVQSLLDLDGEERLTLADTLRVVTATYNNLFDFDMPYIMVFHQKPVDGKDYGFYHMHIEFYPPYRDKEKLKYAAGIEWGAGTFTYDGSPEERAQELKEACLKAVRKLKGG